jgi:hypothetical protein
MLVCVFKYSVVGIQHKAKGIGSIHLTHLAVYNPHTDTYT